MDYTSEKKTVCGVIPVGPNQIRITLVQKLYQRVEFDFINCNDGIEHPSRLVPLGLDELHELRSAIDKAIIAMHSARGHLGDTSDAEQQEADEVWNQFLDEAEC